MNPLNSSSSYSSNSPINGPIPTGSVTGDESLLESETSESSSLPSTVQSLIDSAHRIRNVSARGLKYFLKRNEGHEVKQSHAYKPGDLVAGAYIFQSDKKRGVEPGFEGTKAWTDRDNPDKKHFAQANEFIRYQVAHFRPFMDKLNQILQEPQFQGIDLNAELENDESALMSRLRNDPELIPHVQNFMSGLAVPENSKYRKRHYVKLNYEDPKIPGGKVKIPWYRAKSHKILGNLGKVFHQRATAAPVREKNCDAVKESLANDIFRVTGADSQKLRVVKAKYNDGTIKLLLDATHVAGPKGESFSTLTGQIKKGHLVGSNGVMVKEKDADGNVVKKKYEFDPESLGAMKAKVLLLGDRDKVGSSGANIGFVVHEEDGKAHIYNIDPGKSMERPSGLSEEKRPNRDNYSNVVSYTIAKKLFNLRFYFKGSTDRMKQRNMHTDMSFDQPNATLKDKLTYYKNFGVFDDVPLSAKLAGIAHIQDNWKKVETIFERYKEEFGTDDVQPEINFKEEIDELETLLKNRKEYFDSVFAERMKIYRIDPSLVDLLDHMEKLTSPTASHIKHRKGEIRYKHLHVDPENRREWHMVQEGANFRLSFKTRTEEEHTNLINCFNDYLDEMEVTDIHVQSTPQAGSNPEISFLITPDQINLFKQTFAEANIAEFKGQILAV